MNESPLAGWSKAKVVVGGAYLFQYIVDSHLVCFVLSRVISLETLLRRSIGLPRDLRRPARAKGVAHDLCLRYL